MKKTILAMILLATISTNMSYIVAAGEEEDPLTTIRKGEKATSLRQTVVRWRQAHPTAARNIAIAGGVAVVLILGRAGYKHFKVVPLPEPTYEPLGSAPTASASGKVWNVVSKASEGLRGKVTGGGAASVPTKYEQLSW